MTLGSDSRPRLAAKVRLQHDRHSGRHLLIYPERGMELDAVAASIVQRCDGLRSVADIAGELAREFAEASPQQIERDVLDFLQALADRALLTP